MSDDVTRFEFEGHALTSITYKGQKAWIAREVGRALDYAEDGGRLVKKITGDWADEFLAGRDIIRLDGEDLADFKAVVGEPGTESVPGRAAHLILLTQSGTDLVCVMTRKAVGRRLRRFIVDVALPVVREAMHLAAGDIEPTPALPESPALLRERRLLAREERLGREQRARGFLRLVDHLPDLAPEVRRVLVAKASEAETGEPAPAGVLPVVDDGWLAPTQIAAACRVTPNRVGRAVSALGLRANIPGVARAVMNKAPGIDRSVTTYEYSPRAVTMIREHLASGGFLPAPLSIVPPPEPDAGDGAADA